MSRKVIPDFAEILGVLTPREEQILRMRFGLSNERRRMTLREIGDQFAVGKERIRQIQNRAMNKLSEMAAR